MSRRQRVIEAIKAAIEGKKWQLLKLQEKPYGPELFQHRIDSVQDEQAQYHELLNEIKGGARI